MANEPVALEGILAAEIERLEKNYGLTVEFVLIGRMKDTKELSFCSSPMSEAEAFGMIYSI